MSIDNIKYGDSASFEDVEVISRLWVGDQNRFAPSSTPEILLVLGNDGDNTIAEFKQDIDDYTQVKVENKSTGSGASSDVVCEAEFGSAENGYIDMGINSANYYDEDYSIMPVGSGYLYTIGSGSGEAKVGGDLIIGTASPNRFIKIGVGGMRQENQIMQMGEGYISSSVQMGIGHPSDVSAWLSIGPASNTTTSLHIERSEFPPPATGSTPPGSIFIGPQCGLMRGILGNGIGTTGWFPFTLFKQTAIVEISGSITGSQSITSGVPSTVIFDTNFFHPVQNITFQFYGDASYVGNNRDVFFSIVAQTNDGLTPVTSSTIFTTNTMRFNTMTNRTWKLDGQVTPTATGSACAFSGHGEFIQFTAANTNTPFELSTTASIDNSKPIRLAFIAGWVGNNTVSDKIRCKNGFIQVS